MTEMNEGITSTGFPPEVTAAIAAGRKIEAIRLYRQHAGCDLKTAKEAVERVEQTVRAANPMMAPGQVPDRGGAWVWAVVAAIAIAAIVWYVRR